MNIGQAGELTAAVHELQALVAAQALEIADLRARVQAAETSAAATAEPATHVIESADLQVTGRRRFLSLAAGAAAVAAVTASARGAAPAAAANGTDVMFAGAPNTASIGLPAVTTLLDYSPALATQVDYLRVSDGAATPAFDPMFARYIPAAVAGHARTDPTRVLTGVTGYSSVEGGNGVIGFATGAGGSYGVWGISETGNGVVGRSLTGYDFLGDGAGRIGLAAHVFVGPPQSGSYSAADIIRDSQGSLWACVITGAPGVWRKLAGPTTAGSLHAITPTRVYDSRSPEPVQGFLETGQPRTISVADGRKPVTGAVVSADLVPLGATAIACNITVTETFGSGFVTVNPGINEDIGASTINWSGPNQTMANAIIVGIDEQRQVTLIAGAGGATHLVVDVSGYFL